MSRRWGGLLALLLLTRVPCARAEAVTDDARPLLASSLSPAWADAPDLGPAPAGEVRTIVVSLAPRHPQELSHFLNDVVDPASTVFGRFLTPEEFVARHAPRERAERRLVAYLGRKGLHVTYRAPNRLLVAAEGTIGAIEHAFHVRIHNVGFKGRSRHVARSEPSLPARLARSVVGVVGLGDEGELQPHLVPQQQRADLGPTCCALGPPELARFHGTTGYDGTGRTIAIAGVYAWRTSDVRDFNRAFNLPPLPRGSTQVCTGAAKRPTGCAYSDRGSDEISLDVEYAHATAPGARIVNYMAATPSAADFVVMLNTIVAGGGRRVSQSTAGSAGWVVSTSWGLCEANLPLAQLATYDTILANGIAIGQTWVAASGDLGSRECYDMPSVDFPASSPHVIGVGGTTPTCAGDPSYCDGYGSEIAWSRSGGGASRAFPRPAFQKGCGVPKGTKRLVPDVALAADPAPGYVYRLAGAWRFTGGTSLGAPQWAGFFAQLSQRNGGQPLGHPGKRLYALCGTSAFHDITEGSNGDFTATAGYDQVTGLGSIDAVNFLNLY